MFVSWNKRLSDQTKPISSKDNPFTDNQTSYQIHSIYERFVDDGRKYSEKFDDFICKLIEKCTTAFKPVFISNYMCFPYDEIQQIVQNLSADYQQRTQKTIDKIKETIAQMNSMPTSTDRPLLISASWTAVVMNEFSMAAERAEQNNYNNKITNSECYMCGIWGRYQYDSSEIASKYITQLWEAIKNSFNEQAVHVLFDDTQPFTESKALQKEWEEFRLNPCNVDNYVFLLSNYQFTQSISDIAATFGIDKNELYFKCCDTLSQKLKSQEIPLLLSKEKMLISNMEVFFEKSETDILKELLKQYSNEVVLSLAEVCEKLPDNIKENLPPKKQAAQVSGRLINSIITADNYLLLSRVFGAEWIEKIKQAWRKTLLPVPGWCFRLKKMCEKHYPRMILWM